MNLYLHIKENNRFCYLLYILHLLQKYIYNCVISNHEVGNFGIINLMTEYIKSNS